MVTLASYPVAPAVTPRSGTLLDAANVGEGMAWLDGNDLFESFNCMEFGSAAEFCAPNTKTFDNTLNWVDGIRFAAYGGVQCRAVGLDQDALDTQVSRAFEAGESTAIERALMEQRFRADADPAARWGAATDITPGAAAVDPKVGLALLEGYAASVYVGQPTLHVPRSIAAIVAASDGIVEEGSSLRTKLGAKVAAGAGYDYPNTGPTGAEAAAGEKWLYATGEVVIQRGSAEIRQAVDMTNNDVYVLAERPYIAAVDCFAAAVRVTVTA